MIPPDVIAQVRDRTDIVAVIKESVPSLKRNGRRFIGLCPFHKEKTPSFNVNQEAGYFYCFGCHEKGSVVDFVMKQDGYTFPEAIRMLAERLGIVIEEQRLDARELDDAARARKAKEDLYAVNHLAATFFEKMIREHEHRRYALDELSRRQVVPGENETADLALQAFRIGYAPPEWDGLARFLKAQGVAPTVAETAGLLVPRSSGAGHYDRFRHRLMFAVVDPQGRVVAFSGRALEEIPNNDSTRREEKAAKYINSPESPVYTKGTMLFGLFQARHAIRTAGLAILVEGNFDAFSLHARGIDHVVGVLGTAFTIDQAKLLKRYTNDVVVMLDGDKAGRAATEKARETCRAAGIAARVAPMPDGLDPDAFARERGTEALRELVARAKPMWRYLVEAKLDQSFMAADVHERAQRVDAIVRLLSEEDDPLVRASLKTFVDELSSRIDLHGLGPGRDHSKTSEVFRALVQKVKKDAAAAPPVPPPNSDPRRARIPEKPAGSEQKKAIVGALLDYPELLDDTDVQGALDLLDGNAALTVAAIAKSVRLGAKAGTGEGAGEKVIDPDVFLAQIPQPIHPFASRRLAAPEFENAKDARAILLEAADRLRKSILAQETRELAHEQQRVAGDWEAETELAKEALLRARQKRGVKNV